MGAGEQKQFFLEGYETLKRAGCGSPQIFWDQKNLLLNPINCFTLFNWLGHKIQHMDRCLKFNDKIPKIELALRMK